MDGIVHDPGQSGDEKISTAVTKCLDLFRRVLALGDWDRDPANRSIKTAIQDEGTRFKVWAGNIGAHKSGRSSLDYRLRDASHLQKQVLRLLADLSELHEDAIAIVSGDKVPWDKLDEEPLRDDEGEGFPGDLPDTELGQISRDIVEVVNCLLRLSVSIRNPAPHDRFAAWATTDMSHYEQFDTQHVKSKFGSTINEALATRLGKAISRRRQYFRYRESHHAKLSHGLEEDVKGGELESTVASSIPLQMKDTSQKEPTSQMQILDEDTRSDTGVSETSFASSAPGTAKIRLPSLPKESEKGPFECPFCFMMISATNSISWKRHVYGDLRPYVCLSEDCQTPEREFSRRRDWIQHEMQNHWKTYVCSFGCEDEVRYRSAAALKGHLQIEHKTDVPSGSGLEALIELEARPLRIEEDGVSCQLCGESLLSIQSYRRHVGRHQEQLSLFALPNIAQTDEGEITDEEVSTETEGSETPAVENSGDIRSGLELPDRGERKGADGVDFSNVLWSYSANDSASTPPASAEFGQEAYPSENTTSPQSGSVGEPDAPFYGPPFYGHRDYYPGSNRTGSMSGWDDHPEMSDRERIEDHSSPLSADSGGPAAAESEEVSRSRRLRNLENRERELLEREREILERRQRERWERGERLTGLDGETKRVWKQVETMKKPEDEREAQERERAEDLRRRMANLNVPSHDKPTGSRRKPGFGCLPLRPPATPRAQFYPTYGAEPFQPLYSQPAYSLPARETRSDNPSRSIRRPVYYDNGIPIYGYTFDDSGPFAVPPRYRRVGAVVDDAVKPGIPIPRDKERPKINQADIESPEKSDLGKAKPPKATSPTVQPPVAGRAGTHEGLVDETVSIPEGRPNSAEDPVLSKQMVPEQATTRTKKTKKAAKIFQTKDLIAGIRAGDVGDDIYVGSGEARDAEQEDFSRSA